MRKRQNDIQVDMVDRWRERKLLSRLCPLPTGNSVSKTRRGRNKDLTPHLGLESVTDEFIFALSVAEVVSRTTA